MPTGAGGQEDSSLADEGAVGRFLDERCAVDDPTVVEETTRLFAAWGEWCARSGEAAGTQMRFIQRLQARGLTRGKSAAIRRSSFRGVRLRDHADPSPGP
jgi:putative DNA primase/helicase